MTQPASGVSLNLSGQFYTTYKAANTSFNPDTFDCAEETTDKLLKTATTSDHPGMLLGKVQSGKTRTFISILALAFDNGYDIAIVLSKNSKALIEQTEKRLTSEFTMFINDGELEIYDIMHAPTSFGAFELGSKLIFVAKKQKDNLRRLIDLFTDNPSMAARRTLIIDDEADNASIGYTKKEGLIEAQKIATQITKLRSAIQSSSFLQVTATPYSLYLQPTEVEVANVIESSRLASESSHATYIETPYSKTEDKLATVYAQDHPILFLLRQNGTADGWRGTPFYWPVIRAQARTPTAVYTAETIG